MATQNQTPARRGAGPATSKPSDARGDALAMLESALRRFFAARRIPPDEDAIREWVFGLMADGVKVGQACEALREFAIHCTDYPTIAGVRRYLPGALGLTLQERSMFAWGHVCRAVRQYGRGSTWAFDDPVINAAVRSVGGQAPLCDGDSGTLAFREKGFRAAYETIARTGVGDARPIRALDGPDCPTAVIACADLPITETSQRLIEHQPQPINPIAIPNPQAEPCPAKSAAPAVPARPARPE